MTDPYNPVIDLTNLCSIELTNNNIDNAVIELLDDSQTSSESITYPRRARRRGRSGSTRICNEETIVITDSPQVNTDTDNHRLKRRKITKNKKEALDQNDEERVRERSPLGGCFGVCPICLDTLGKRPMVSTKCGHVYCQNCLTQALQSERKCPTCRKSLKGNGAYHPLFLNRE